MIDSDHPDSEQDYEEVSKTQIKKEMQELQDLGQKLLKLSPQQLAQIPLPDRLAAAIDEAKRIKSNEALRRHSQFIGRLMRDADHEAIRLALDLMDPSSEAFARQQSQVEQWRDRLLSAEPAELDAFFEQFPDTDRQHLRQLQRNSIKEQTDKPEQWVQRKKLFQYIKSLQTP